MRALLSLTVVLALAAPVFARAGQSAGDPAMPRVTTDETLPRIAMARPLPASAALPSAAAPRHAATPTSAPARPVLADPATLCETAITTAEFVNRLPPRMLGAISLTETGRIDPVSGRVRPWPWTINAEGAGQFFDTEQAAIAAVKALRDRGVQSIDVGCLQVNLMYHPDAFATLEAGFDPRTNASYAAHFLNALYAASKDWPTAIGAYHSETPVLGDAYRVLVMARWQNGDPHAVVTGAVAYGDFADSAKAYGAKVDTSAYGAFAPRSLSYGAFAPR